jgi:hypothetical protein
MEGVRSFQKNRENTKMERKDELKGTFDGNGKTEEFSGGTDTETDSPFLPNIDLWLKGLMCLTQYNNPNMSAFQAKKPSKRSILKQTMT